MKFLPDCAKQRPTSKRGHARLSCALALGAAATLAASGAGAAQPHKPTAAQIQALSQCVAISEDAARLACYDKTAKELVEAEKSGDVVVVDKAQVKEVKRQSFGFNINLGPLFDHGSKAEQVNELATTVESAFKNGEDKWMIRTADGQLWRQIGDEALYESPKKGEKVVIKRGSLGSFFLKVGNDIAMRAHRDE